MNTAKNIALAALVFTFVSCGTGEDKYEKNISAADSGTANKSISSDAAVEGSKDAGRKFIRTADLKFKVKDVAQSTYNIEDITVRNGGFVTYTNLASNIDNIATIRISADSAAEVTTYTATNEMTLRVPNTKLDTTLKAISATVDYLDYRVIKAEDVALTILANRMSVTRSIDHRQRLINAIDNKGVKLKDITSAEQILSGTQENADKDHITDLSLADQVCFSTVKVLLYQRQAVKTYIIANIKTILPYEPGLGSRLADSIVFGWIILKELIVFAARFWAIAIAAILCFAIYKNKTLSFKK